MALPKLENFLYFLDLRIGSLLIGLLEAIQGIRSFFYEASEVSTYTYGIMGIILAVLVLYGTLRLNVHALYIFVILSFITAVIAIVLAVLSFTDGFWEYGVVGLFVAALSVYFALVVNSYASSLDAQSIPGNV